MKVRRSIEIVSDSAQFVNDSASFASGAVKVYGYDTTRGWKNAAKIVLSSPQDKDGLRYKSSNGTWVNYSLLQKRLQFQVSVTTNAPTPGDSTLTNQGFYAKHLRLYREGLMQTQDDTIVGFELSDSLLTVHPPWVEGERVIVETSDTTVWETLALSPPPPVDSSWVNLPFGTVVQLTNTDSIWQSTVGLGSVGVRCRGNKRTFRFHRAFFLQIRIPCTRFAFCWWCLFFWMFFSARIRSSFGFKSFCKSAMFEA
jgi:hypothetical protein